VQKIAYLFMCIKNMREYNIFVVYSETMARTAAGPFLRRKTRNQRQTGRRHVHPNPGISQASPQKTESVHTSRRYFGQFNRNRRSLIEQKLSQSKTESNSL
jgi:hypothetical protein